MNVLLNSCNSHNALDFMEIINEFMQLTQTYEKASLCLGVNRDLFTTE